jgi:hypothetical protein
VSSPSSGSPVAPTPTVNDAALLWHRRMGHVWQDCLAKLVKVGLVTGVSVFAGDFKPATGDFESATGRLLPVLHVFSASMLGHPC